VILDTNGLSAVAEGDSALEPILCKAVQVAIPVIVQSSHQLEELFTQALERAIDRCSPARTPFPRSLAARSPVSADISVQLGGDAWWLVHNMDGAREKAHLIYHCTKPLIARDCGRQVFCSCPYVRAGYGADAGSEDGYILWGPQSIKGEWVPQNSTPSQLPSFRNNCSAF
jgi:hypothetical protein